MLCSWRIQGLTLHVVLIIKAVKIECALLFTTFRRLWPGLGEKFDIFSNLISIENHPFCHILSSRLLVSLLRLLFLTVQYGRSLLAVTGILFAVYILLSPSLWQSCISVKVLCYNSCLKVYVLVLLLVPFLVLPL